MPSIVGFLVRRSGGWETLHAPASGDRHEELGSKLPLDNPSDCRDSLVRALGGVFGARMSANRARELLITLMWIGFGALALVVVANA